MVIRHWIAGLGLAFLLTLTGCQAWCQRNYPCPPVHYGYGAAPVACLPCCPPGSGYQAAPAPVPARTWGNPTAGGVPCVPCN